MNCTGSARYCLWINRIRPCITRVLSCF